MNLATHISYLLKFHECVIIPEFGGFVSNYKPAQFDSIRNTFIPPGKEIIFNSKINKNDGLLINYLVDVEKIGYHQAQLIVLNFVDRLNTKLNKGETIELEGIGTLAFDRSGSMVFNAETKLELTDAYGLSEFSYPTLRDNIQSNAYQPRQAVRAINSRKDVLKIAASIALLLTLSLYPLKNQKVSIHSSVLNPIEFLVNDLPVVSEKIEKVTEQTKELKTLSPYILVGGSFHDLENANQLLTELNEKGYQSEIIELENGFFRVVIESFTDKQEAISAMKTYRTEHKGSDVWVSIR